MLTGNPRGLQVMRTAIKVLSGIPNKTQVTYYNWSDTNGNHYKVIKRHKRNNADMKYNTVIKTRV